MQIPQSYYDYMLNRESGGNPSASNPRSSALGSAQFLKGTWAQLIRQHPELGLTPDGRTDSSQNDKAMRAFTQDNASTLENSGYGDPKNLYLAHRFGAQGATSLLGADPEADGSTVLPPQVIAANPDLRGKSVAQIIGGNQFTGDQQSPEALASAKASLQQQPSQDDDGALPPSAQPTAYTPGGQQPQPSTTDRLSNIGTGLLGAGAALQSIDNPMGGSVLSSLAKNAMAQRQMQMPEWGVIKEDPYTGQKVYGWINKANQTTTPANGSPGGSGSGSQPDFETVVKNIQGRVSNGASPTEAIDAEAPGPLKDYAKALIKGDAVPFNMGRNAAARSSAILLAHAADPNFNENVIPMRQAYAKGMASLSPQAPGGQVASANTIVEHLDGAFQHGQAIFNNGPLAPSDTLSMLNGAKMSILDQKGDQTYKQHYTAYQSDIKAISEELEKLLSGRGGAESSKQYWLKQLSLANGPTAAYNALAEVQRLMEGRLVPLAYQKQEAWGTPTTSADLLNPSAKEKYAHVQKFVSDINGGGAPEAPAPQQAAPPAPQSGGIQSGSLPPPPGAQSSSMMPPQQPQPQAPPQPQAAPQQAPQQQRPQITARKTVGNKSYVKVGNDWFQE